MKPRTGIVTSEDRSKKVRIISTRGCHSIHPAPRDSLVVYDPHYVRIYDLFRYESSGPSEAEGLISKTMSYYFYLARCSDGSLYTGSCSDLQTRETRHNEGKGAAYTRNRRPVKIIYSEKFETNLEARRREAQVKPWNRMKKENLSQGKHPTKGI